MLLAKFASTPLPISLRLSQRDCPTSDPKGEDMKSVPYAPAVGSLMYTMVATRPDISHTVGVVSIFMHNPGRSHWNVVKHVFRYLAGTKDHVILFELNKDSGVVGYTDSDFADSVDSRKSTTGYCFKFGYLNDRSRIRSRVGRGESCLMAQLVGAHISTSRLRLVSSSLQRQSRCCCSVEKSGSSQRL